MKCEECKFDWGNSECKTSCKDCIYGLMDYSYVCEKCGELSAHKDNGGCNFEEEDGDEE